MTEESLSSTILGDEEMDTMLRGIVSRVLQAHTESDITEVPMHSIACIGSVSKTETEYAKVEFEMRTVPANRGVTAETFPDYLGESLAMMAPVIMDEPKKVLIAFWIIGTAWVAEVDEPVDEVSQEVYENRSEVIMIAGISLDKRANSSYLKIRRDDDGAIRVNGEEVFMLGVKDSRESMEFRMDLTEKALTKYLTKIVENQKGAV